MDEFNIINPEVLEEQQNASANGEHVEPSPEASAADGEHVEPSKPPRKKRKRYSDAKQLQLNKDEIEALKKKISQLESDNKDLQKSVDERLRRERERRLIDAGNSIERKVNGRGTKVNDFEWLLDEQTAGEIAYLLAFRAELERVLNARLYGKGDPKNYKWHLVEGAASEKAERIGNVLVESERQRQQSGQYGYYQ